MGLIWESSKPIPSNHYTSHLLVKAIIKKKMMHIYNFSSYMHVNAGIYGLIWPYKQIYAVFRRPRGMLDLFIVHSHPGS